MKKLNEVCEIVQNYLKSIGVSEEVRTNEILEVKSVLVLRLSDVCILKENRPYSTAKQTHIHVTGEGMKFFYDAEILSTNPKALAEDVEENVLLFRKNLEDLEKIAKVEHGYTREMEIPGQGEVLYSKTFKKVGRIGSPSVQVQISKLRMDEAKFLHLRRCLFTGDALVFMKKENGISVVVGIPQSYLNEEPLSSTVVLEKKEQANNGTVVSTAEEGEKGLRNVDYSTIATFNAQDEEDDGDNQSNNFDLSGAIATRKKRTERHQDIVKMLALDLERRGYLLYENPVDCYAFKINFEAMLFEIKTLDGTIADERKQVQKAFSQLFYYEQFNISENKENGIKKVAVFESKISDEHIAFFENNSIEVIWLDENKHFVNCRGEFQYK